MKIPRTVVKPKYGNRPAHKMVRHTVTITKKMTSRYLKDMKETMNYFIPFHVIEKEIMDMIIL